jgi:hypothetical protein
MNDYSGLAVGCNTDSTLPLHLSLYKATVYTHLEDPPKSPFSRWTFNAIPPFLRGVRGDLNAVKPI